ncbi:unnamed protein product [Peronospora destructor]|uniref:HEAT repeat-containing protein 1 n=1 Tax=Peronospora destructor TaxID=86335 RepID=A0AAV0UY02_9STRA|nr:unnamed protein product [Peronospora destructor]
MAGVDQLDVRREDVAAFSTKDSDNDMMSVGRLHSGLQQLLTTTNSDALKTHPAGHLLTKVEPTVEEHDIYLHLQALASCLVHDELRVLIVKYLRPFLLDLMVRLTDPILVLYEQQEQDTYRECSDSMKKSELLAATLAELLNYLPTTSTLAYEYFKSAQCFFAFADIVAPQKQQSNETVTRLRRIAKTAFLLLRARPTELTLLWNWTPFFPLSFHDDIYVRWYAARATASILKMGNRQRSDFLDGLNVGEEAAVSCSSSVVRQIELELSL